MTEPEAPGASGGVRLGKLHLRHLRALASSKGDAICYEHGRGPSLNALQALIDRKLARVKVQFEGASLIEITDAGREAIEG